MKKLIGGNWKMNANSSTLEAARKFRDDIHSDADVFIAVPYVYMKEFRDIFSTKINLAAQDLSCHEKGAYTGEISAEQLEEFNVKYVLVGHSERRIHHNETDELINEKLKNSLKNGIEPVLCIGEALNVRSSGKYIDFLHLQFQNSCRGIYGCSIDVAYEPVWAIGTGKAAKNSEIEEVIAKIKEWMEESNITGRCLYGGSVSLDNVEELKRIHSLDGLLIGNASLDSRFTKIISKFASD